MPKRMIVNIIEEQCDGCGLCITACEEGALEIVNGKAQIVHDRYCDGLGVCIGECPQDALEIEVREAAAFDEEAVLKRQAEQSDGGEIRPVANWPVQMHLVPPKAPFFDGETLVLTADCVPFVLTSFHRRFGSDQTVVVGCPKFDDNDFYLRKLTQILEQNDVQGLDVVYMEVPCCIGLVRLAREAAEAAGKQFALSYTRVGVDGTVSDTQQLRLSGEAVSR